MERNDIATYQKASIGCFFEGLLASPPKPHRLLFKRTVEDRTLRGWLPHDIPLKSLVYQTTRLGMHIDVITLLGYDMEDPIYRWLSNRGVRTNVHAYESLDEFVEVIRYNEQFKTIYVPTEDLWKRVGIRATVVPPTHELGHSFGIK